MKGDVTLAIAGTAIPWWWEAPPTDILPSLASLTEKPMPGSSPKFLHLIWDLHRSP